MSKHALAIQGGLVIEKGGASIAKVAIDGERIAVIGDSLAGAVAIDAAGCCLILSAIDPHVHLQMPLAGRVSTDACRSGAVAVAHCGASTVVDFGGPQPGESMLEALALRRGLLQVGGRLHAHRLKPASATQNRLKPVARRCDRQTMKTLCVFAPLRELFSVQAPCQTAPQTMKTLCVFAPLRELLSH